MCWNCCTKMYKSFLWSCSRFSELFIECVCVCAHICKYTMWWLKGFPSSFLDFIYAEKCNYCSVYVHVESEPKRGWFHLSSRAKMIPHTVSRRPHLESQSFIRAKAWNSLRQLPHKQGHSSLPGTTACHRKDHAGHGVCLYIFLPINLHSFEHPHRSAQQKVKRCRYDGSV